MTLQVGMMLGRRDVVQLLVLASAGLACAPFGGSAEPFATGPEELRAFLKLQTRTDTGYTAYCNTGTVYAAVPGRQSVPLYGYEGLLRFHTRVTGPDRYEVTFIEAGAYLDLETGECLTRFANPISGATNRVEHVVEGPMSWQWTADNLHAADPAPGLRRHIVWQHLEGQSAVQFDNMIEAALPGGARFNAAALVSYVGSTEQLRDRRRTSVAETMLIDNSINPWAPWLAMGDAPGRLVNNIVGRKLGAMAEVPERLTKFIAATHPKVLGDIERWKAAG